jgi:hypothetical protein
VNSGKIIPFNSFQKGFDDGYYTLDYFVPGIRPQHNNPKGSNILEVNLFPFSVARVGSSDLYGISFCRNNLSSSFNIPAIDDKLDSKDEPTPETKYTRITKFLFFISQNVTLQA